MLNQRFTTRCPSATPRSRGSLKVLAFGDSHSTGAFQPGMRVKVTSPVKLYSVPKHPEGIVIEGMEGEVFKDVSIYKGKVLSAGLPYVVKFVTEIDGKEVKFQAHLGEDEIAAV